MTLPGDRRALLALVLLASLAACRAAPAWEPVGGFELLPPPESWRDVTPGELEGWLDEARRSIASVHDYAATLETRERIEDELFPRRVIQLKLRERPFAAALETLEPPSEAGQRVWYDETESDELVAETPGLLGKLVGHVSLDPGGDLALENRRHPITDLGLARLLQQVDGQFAPELAQRPRLRSTEVAFGGKVLRLVDALVAREPPDPPLVHRLGFEADSGLLTYYGLAELLPDGLALVEEYAYRDLRLDPSFGPEAFRPAK